MPVHRPTLVMAATAATALVLIAACGEEDSGGESASTPPTTVLTGSPTEPPTSAPASSEPPANLQEITVTVADGEITPPPDRIEVDEGMTVRIVVNCDVADEIHVHGYEREAEVGPGRPATIEFVADQGGLFAVELHELDKVLFQLQVQ